MNPPTMFLQRVAISRFRLIHEITMDMEPGTSVLIGENASGKSSVLSLIDRVLGVGRPADEAMVGPDDLHREPDGTTVDRPVTVTLTFAAPGDDPGEARHDTPDEVPARRIAKALQDLLLRSETGEGLLHVRVRAHPKNDPTGTFELVDDAGAVRSGVPGSAAIAELVRRFFPVIRLRADRRVGGEARSAKGEGASGLRGLERVIADAAERVLRDPEAARAEDEPEAVIAARRMLHRHIQVAHGASGEKRRISMRAARHAGAGAESLLLVLLIAELLRARGDNVIDPDAFPIVLIEEAEAHLHPIALAGIWRLIESLAAQRIVTTNSGELLAWTPLRAIRRMVRIEHGVRVCSAAQGKFDADELRRIGHHISRSRAGAFFARCWLLVEGETEVWLLPELARRQGIEFAREGVRCLEFAQCGVSPLVRLADHLGIAWHLLTDGDQAGRGYADTARGMLRGRQVREHITLLRESDIEVCLWDHGYADIFRRYAGHPARGRAHEQPHQVIQTAIRAASKPALALAVVEAAMAEDSPGIPPVIESVLGKALRMAREPGCPD